MSKRNKRACGVSIVGVVLVVIAVTLLKNDPAFNNTGSFANNPGMDTRSEWGIILLIGGAFFILQPWIWRWVSSTYDAARRATTPLPSPHEIYEELTAYYGRPATIEEVAAAQSIYAHNRNEAAAQAALGVGAFLLLHDAAKRSKG